MSDSRPTPSKLQTFVSVLTAMALILSWPASCECARRNERNESEAICRRAIERKYSAPATEAESLIRAQREWEGR